MAESDKNTCYALATTSDVSGGIRTFNAVTPAWGTRTHADVLIAASSPIAISWHCAKNGLQTLRLVLSTGCRGSLLPAVAERSSVCVIRYKSKNNTVCHTITALDCGWYSLR